MEYKIKIDELDDKNKGLIYNLNYCYSRASSLSELLNWPWTVDEDDDDLFFVSTNQKPEFLTPQWNQCYSMKEMIEKKQWD